MMLSLLLASAIASGTSVAYLSPEEVLLQQQAQYFQPAGNYVTPNARRLRLLGTETAKEREALHPSTFHDPNIDANTPTNADSSSSDAFPFGSQASSVQFLPRFPSTVNLEPATPSSLDEAPVQDPYSNEPAYNDGNNYAAPSEPAMYPTDTQQPDWNAMYTEPAQPNVNSAMQEQRLPLAPSGPGAMLAMVLAAAIAITAYAARKLRIV